MRKPNHGRGGSFHIGRSRKALAKLLQKTFPEWDVQPEDIKPVTGSYRTCIYHDVYRWELFTRTKTGLPVVMGCWWTIRDFLKHSKKSDTCHHHQDELYPGEKNE